MFTKEEEKALDTLSKELFGSKRRWKKILVNGYAHAISTKRVGRKGKVCKESEQRYLKPEGLMPYLEDIKAKRETLLAEMKAQADGNKQVSTVSGSDKQGADGSDSQSDNPKS